MRPSEALAKHRDEVGEQVERGILVALVLVARLSVKEFGAGGRDRVQIDGFEQPTEGQVCVVDRLAVGRLTK